uniref:Uncharacterized protein n=1 Tax=Panagrolaimus sp. JU765 TaxID=591449 RepID=A0AC34QJ89_9BILA
MRTCLYKDQYVTLYKDELVINSYFFPFGSEKTIKVKDIIGVYYDKQGFLKGLGKVKDWGMSLNPVWWGCDLKRSFTSNNFNVIVDTGEWPKKGFSVVRITDFLNALRQVVHPSVQFKKEIPSSFPKAHKPEAIDKSGVREEVLKPEPEIPEKRPVYFDEMEPTPNASAPPPYEQAVAYPRLDKFD